MQTKKGLFSIYKEGGSEKRKEKKVMALSMSCYWRPPIRLLDSSSLPLGIANSTAPTLAIA